MIQTVFPRLRACAHVARQLFCFALAAALAAAALAQQSAAQPAPAAQQPRSSGSDSLHSRQRCQQAAASRRSERCERADLHVGVNEVSLIFTVTDRHGHYIPNLKQSDFALLDDQRAPAQGQLAFTSRSTCPCAWAS